MSKKENLVTFIDTGPIKPRAKYDWWAIENSLRSNPGKWATIGAEGAVRTPGAAAEAARTLRTGRVTGSKAGEFEAAARGTTVYGRYVGNINSD